MGDIKFNAIGKSVPRNDGYDKATGRGMYVYDYSVPGMLYAKALRSPYEHAKIISMDTSAAEALEGVKAVLTPFNGPKYNKFSTAASSVITPAHLTPIKDQLIVTAEPLYIGDEVAIVAASSEKIAEEACKLIKVEYEELPHVLGVIDAEDESSPWVHPEFKDIMQHNVCGDIVQMDRGDLAKAFAEADFTAEATMVLPIQKQCPMEPCGAVADYANGRLKVVCNTQTPQMCKMMLARVFDLSESKVRIDAPYVGGGFGEKIGFAQKAEVIASIMSMMTAAPVKFMYTREEDFIATDTRHNGIVKGRMAAKKDGTITGIDVHSRLDTGAYASFGALISGIMGALGVFSCYRAENVSYNGCALYTNRSSAGAMRGYGTPQGTVIVETLIDDIAKQIGMDAVEIRLKNTSKVGDVPLMPVGATCLNDCIEKVAESVNWKEIRGKKKTGVIRKGVGLAAGTHCSNAGPDFVDYDCCEMRIEGDGSLTVCIAIDEIGPGSTTALLQIAADAVGVKFEETKMECGHSDVPFSIGSHASRTLYCGGTVIMKASAQLKAQILDWAADFLKADRSKLDLELGVIKGDGQEYPLSELAYRAHLLGKRFMVVENTLPPNSYPWHAHSAAVEVDTETGIIKLTKLAAAHDLGKVVNPSLCASQITGAVIQGAGYALREEMTYVEGKGYYNSGYHKYMLPTAGDIPPIDVFMLESNDPVGPVGVKSVGEGGIVPTCPAILSAVEDAIGIRFYEFPLTPGRVLDAIKKARAEGMDI